MRVALVHDFLIEYGGAERVLEALHEIWPKAPVYTAFYDPQSLGINAARFKNWKIITSWGTKLPFWQKLVSPYRIFSKKFFESFDLSGFDLVISSSNAYMAKAVHVPNGIHICYCHTPPRFLYGYPTALNWRKNLLLRPIGEVINHFMRVWDFETAQAPLRGPTPLGVEPRINGRVDYFIANSKEVQARIKKFYRRDSTVIYPPVDMEKFVRGPVSSFPPAPSINSGQAVLRVYPERSRRAVGSPPRTATPREPYFLVVSRLVAAKNVDIAVETCAKLGLPLKVVGAGREIERLKQIVKQLTATRHSGHTCSGLTRILTRIRFWSLRQLTDPTIGSIQFLGEVSDQELINLYQNCRAVIFPASQEDFGLVPLEAAAAGKPVIANAEGGVLESVIDASSGHSTLRGEPSGHSTVSAQSNRSDSSSSAQAGQRKGKCTGVYFDPPTTGSLTLALNNFTRLEKQGYFDPKFIRRHAQKFSKDRFKREILKFVFEKVK